MKFQKKNLNYDAQLRWIITPYCNLDCTYCINKDVRKEKIKNIDKISEIDIPALIKTLDQTKKTFRINFTGGEPFLVPNLIEACTAITKKHFISFSTNLTSIKIKEFAEKINPGRVISIFASAHIKELEKFNLLDTYINNFILCKEKGFFINASEVAHPQFLKEVEKYKIFFQQKGIRLIFQPFIGKYNGKIYPESYTEKEIELFGLKKEKLNKTHQKGKLCNAGYNIISVNFNGNIKHCPFLNKFDGNIYEKIIFNDKLMRCPFEFCGCPLNILDPYLFKKAMEKINLNNASPDFLKKNFI